MAIEDWYDAQRQGLGAEFRDEVDAAIARVANNPLIYTRSATEERGVRSYDDFPTFSGIDRTTPSWWSSLACTASAIPVLSALDFSGAAKSRTPLQGR